MARSTFGRYEIRGELGRGGMATVYHAFDPHFQRDVALKILPFAFMHDEQFRERFIREARAVAALEHWAIVPVHDYGEQDEQPFFVMRYMPGGSLLDRIQAGRLSLEEVTTTIERIAAALDFAHRRDVIHRDVKPANILFDEEGDAYLSDFGIVKLTETTAQLTGSGIVGSPTYMAPEMVHQGSVTPLIDVYALGVTLFQMLTGHPPYEADTPMGTALAHTARPVPQLSDWRLALPEGMQAVIEGALAKDPADRYQSARALAADLRGVVSGGQTLLGAQPGPDTVQTPAPTAPTIEGARPTQAGATSPSAPPAPTARPARRGFLIGIVAVLGLIGVVVMAGLAYAFWPRGAGVAQVPATEAPASEIPPTEEPERPTPTVVGKATLQIPPYDPWGVTVIDPDQYVKIVINTPTTDLHYADLGSTEALATWVAEGEDRELFGHIVELSHNDMPCDVENTERVANYAATYPGVVAVIGHTCAASCALAAQIYEEARLTMVSASCTAGYLTDPDAPRSFMRTAPNDNVQGVAAAEYAYHVLGVRRAATIDDRSSYAADLVAVFADRFEALGGEVVAQTTLNIGETDIRPALNALAAQEPDMLYFPLFSNAGGLVAVQSAEIEGLRDIIRMGSDHIRNDEFLGAAGSAAEGVYATAPEHVHGPGYDEFLEQYFTRFVREPAAPIGPESYDEFNLIMQALEAVTLVGEDGTLYIGRHALREEMYASSFDGLSGRIECNEVGDCNTAPTEFAQVQDGEFVVVGSK